MDAAVLANLAAYCTQVACIALAAILLPALLRIDAPGFRYGFWRTLLGLCLVLPWLQARRPPPSGAGIQTTEVVSTAPGSAMAAPAIERGGLDWTTVVLLILAVGVLMRLIWIAVGFVRLQRLRHAGEPAIDDDSAELQRVIQTRADIRYLADCKQPVTFGLWRPVVLLPDTLRSQSVEIRQAVLAHELVHVRRRDWAWVLGEELVRAVFWFHPVMWWLISRVQLAREEVVDALAVSLTGRRRAYIEALLACAGGLPLAPAPAFARRRHLFRRLILISREDDMTARRLVASAVALTVLVVAGGWYAVAAFPMREGAAAQVLRMEPGPLEQAANRITTENPVPERVQHEPAEYPAEAAAANASVRLAVLLTIDGSGSVAEMRPMSVSLKTDDYNLTFNLTNFGRVEQALEELGKASIRARPGSPAESLGFTGKAIIEATINAAAAAAARWQYAPPAHAPVSIPHTFFFAPGAPVADALAPPPPPPPPPPPGGAIKSHVRIKVGGAIKPPLKTRDVRPVYPPEAKEQGVEGVVIAEVTIDEAGRVSDARVLRSIPMLDQAALDAVRQWEFQPTLLNGVAMPVQMTVTIQFSLQ